MTTGITEQVTRLTEAKAAIASSIEAKGVDVPESATLDEYSAFVDEITTSNVTVEGPLYAQTIEDCTDTSKLYLLPDGYLYAYVESTQTQTITDNVVTADNPVFDDTRLGSDGSNQTDAVSYAGYVTTPYIDLLAYPVPFTLRMEGAAFMPAAQDGYTRCCTYDSAKSKISCGAIVATNLQNYLLASRFSVSVDGSDAAVTFTKTPTTSNDAAMQFIRFSGRGEPATTRVYVTYDQEVTGYQWTNTGLKYTPTLTTEEKQEIAEMAAAMIDTQLASVVGTGVVSV